MKPMERLQPYNLFLFPLFNMLLIMPIAVITAVTAMAILMLQPACYANACSMLPILSKSLASSAEL